MKLLLVGDGEHQFIINLVKWLKKEGKFENIDILTNREIGKKNVGLYSRIFSINKSSRIFNLLNKIKGVRRLYKYFLYRKLVNEHISSHDYDYIHVHFLSIYNLHIANLMESENLILSVWGSDYYRADDKRKRKLFKTANKARYITFTNEATKEDFQDVFKNSKKLKICRFGLAPLEVLKELDETRLQSKQKLGLDKNKITVTIGYNLNRGQQHLDILDQIADLNTFNSRIELLLPITYGGDEKYKNEIVEKLRQLPFKYKIFDQFLDDLTVSRIRSASDIMVQLQITDQFSGSMQEHLYARNIVITGSWLPYKTMKDYGVEFLEINTISDLSGKLLYVLNNYNRMYSQTEGNPEAILKLSSWGQNISDWLKLYE